MAIFDCKDCGVNTNDIGEYYMVLDSIWKEAGMGKEDGAGMLCIGDLEKRLGRTLTAKDFMPNVPVNIPDLVPWLTHSERLRNRLSVVK